MPHASQNSYSSQEINSRTHNLMQYDVTDLVAKQNWNIEDNLEAVVTSSWVGNLPQPVIIRRLRDEPYEVEVPRGKARTDYGDLLDSFRKSP